MNMVDIWLTAAANEEFEALRGVDRAAVASAISIIATGPAHPEFRYAHHRLNIPPGPGEEPFFAMRSGGGSAPAVIYRRTAPGEHGDWLVVSLMRPEDYDAMRRAEDTLAAASTLCVWLVQRPLAGCGG
jgi:hypothetical protein